MTQNQSISKTLASLWFHEYEEEDEEELEVGFIEEESEDDNLEEDDGIEWFEEFETETDGPMGPFIIKKGRYTEAL